MTFDPYTYGLNAFGNPVKINVSQVEKNKVLWRLMSASTSFGYTFNNATFKKKKKQTPPPAEEPEQSELEKTLMANDPLYKAGLRDEREARKEKRKKEDSAYQAFSMPWSLTLNYSIRYAYDKFNPEIMEYDRKLSHNLSISGRINFTKTWAFTLSTYYDITENTWSYMNCTITKDLHCWQMSASFVPIGKYSTYNFMIGVKSSLLRDLKYNKQSDYSDKVTWY